MTAARRAVLVIALLATAACGRAEGVADTRRALEAAGFTEVDVGVRSGGGIDVVRVDAAGGDPDRAAEVVWDTMPVRFDQLVVTLGPSGPRSGDSGPSGPRSGNSGPSGPRNGDLGAGASSYGYQALVERFGPRDPDLDRKQLSDQVVRDGLDLMLLLSLGAVLSLGGVVALGLLLLRTARRARSDQADGPTSPPADEASPTAGASATEADGPEAIPS